jgi:hypothetical protein
MSNYRAIETVEQALAEVTESGANLWKIPSELQTPEVCLAAVKAWGMNLCDVPENLKTYEVCLAAVKSNILALIYVPKNISSSLNWYLEKLASNYIYKQLKVEESAYQSKIEKKWK